MNSHAPVSLEVTSCLQSEGRVSDSTYDPDLYFPVNKRKTDAVTYHRRRPVLYTWAPLLSLLLLVSLILSCFRTARVGISTRNAGRRLAAGWLTDEEDPEQSAIVEACLDLQQATGTLHQSVAPLPSPKHAIAHILAALLEHAPEADVVTAQAASPVPPASNEPEPAAVPHQRGPSPAKEAGSEIDASRPWQEIYGQAVPVAPEDALALPSPTGSFPSYQPAYGLLQPRNPPGSPPPFVASPLLATPQQRAAPVAEEAFGDVLAALGEKEKVTGPGVEKAEALFELPELQEVPSQPQPQPQPKKHTSGWKGKRPLSAASQGPPEREAHGSSLTWQQAQEPPSQEPEEDPFLKTFQAVPYVWSPEPLDLAEFFQSHSPKGSECEKKEGDSKQEAPETEVEGLYFHEVTSCFSEISPVTGATPPTATPLPRCSMPSTSQVLKSAAPDFLKEPLPGPSGLPRRKRRSTKRRGGGSQGAFPGVSPGPASQTPPAIHPFYRLPVVLPGKITSSFSPTRAFYAVNRRSHGFNQLATARSLLAKPEITPREAEVLIQGSEVLVGRLLYELETPVDPHGPSRAVEKLGRIFLYMDTLVCITNLLEPQMEPDAWWPRVARHVLPETIYTAGQTAGLLSAEHAAFASRLSSVLQILKTRTRLDCTETVELKRELLCSPRTTKDFKKPKWDAWRADDANSGDPAPHEVQSGLNPTP